jgi:hypothetical protein
MDKQEQYTKIKKTIEEARFVLNEIEDQIGVDITDDLPGLGDAIAMHGDTLDDLLHEFEDDNKEDDD